MKKRRGQCTYYFSVLEGREEPNFFHAKRVEVEFSGRETLEELLELHNEGLDRLRENDFTEKPEKNPPRPEGRDSQEDA
ncbi:hypothetical protein [Thermococcus peptonophilus]|uniref:hypothetical protein n=1 Tax=Thermococcus peptonophilus TaxID=53952 RepID=UPI0034669FE3